MATVEAEFERALDQEWSDAQRKAQRDQDESIEAAFSPYLLLYTGFFLGPFVTFLVTLIVVHRRPRLRNVLFLLGVSGATWSVLQGLTWHLHSSWSLFALQAMRTSFNLGLGLFCILAVRSWYGRSLVHSRQTIFNTVILAALMVVIFMSSMSSPVLVWLGR
ncbi:MAG: hypothetical protein ACNA8W_12165 [Bradymonadaceae bacterium]